MGRFYIVIFFLNFGHLAFATQTEFCLGKSHPLCLSLSKDNKLSYSSQAYIKTVDVSAEQIKLQKQFDALIKAANDANQARLKTSSSPAKNCIYVRYNKQGFENILCIVPSYLKGIYKMTDAISIRILATEKGH